MRSVLMFTSLLILTSPMTAQEAAQEQCSTSKCHPTIAKGKYVHGPVSVGDCRACHTLVPKEKHKFQPTKNVGELCYTCHEPIEKKPVMHKPVLDGQCTSCHNPHASDQQFMVRTSPVGEVCFSCHKREIVQKASKHGPAAQGLCTDCHGAHGSEKEKLLSHAGNEVCFECHSDVQEALAATTHKHKPAAEDCKLCHDPHSGNAPYMLAKAGADECFRCHPAMADRITKASVKHAALSEGKGCLNCHSPHEAVHSRQLKDAPMALCLTCHDKQERDARGVMTTDMKELFDANKDWHGPIREKDCSGCHSVHGSGHFRLLIKNYPREFYASFAVEQYDLCFSCHQPTLVQDAATTTLTGFRDGEQNLHFLHVNKKVKGRTCRSCHETHASQKARHIRNEVPFGKWMLPIKFEKTANGGSCSPGCHAPKSYDNKSNRKVSAK